MRLRFLSLIASFTLVFLFAAFTVYNLQIKNGAYYTERVRAQNEQAGLLNPPRALIYVTDKNNSRIPAAMNKEYPMIYASPVDIGDAEEASQMLSQVLNLDAETLLPILQKPEDRYEKLISRATKEQIAALRETPIKGIYVDSEEARFYPFGSFAAHVFGFTAPTETDPVARGRYGLEAQYNEALSGTAGTYSGKDVTAPVNGEAIVTTLDRTIQIRSEEVLQQLVETYQPTGGTIIVQEPTTGKIMAMASYPTFDPNEYGKAEVEDFLNPAVQAVYEPGSIFKVFTMAIGLDSNKITPETTYYDTGELNVNGRTIRNWDHKAHGTLTMTEVIEGSVNTGAAFAERKIGHDLFYQYLVKFGLKELTGIDLPGEIIGRLTSLEKNKQEINFATASFGQGVSVTPIRLITMISAIANKGIMNQPYITEAYRSNWEFRVIGETAAKQVTAMMVSAVKKASVAAIPHYAVAGKTGTAQIPDFKNGGYLDFEEGVIHSYAGFAPAYDPKFTILIKLDKPKSAPLAGQTVVPAFRELSEFLLNYFNVPPTE